jgi:hypothetical protein
VLLLLKPICCDAVWVAQNYNANVTKIEENPLKGLIPAFNTPINSFPHSMEFFYIPLRSIMLGINSFDWSSFDNELVRINSQGKHAIFRVYLDYPGRTTGIPQFLLDGGLATNNYTDYGNANVSLSPNWNDSNLMLAIENFIAALGARYDGSPRVAFITIGIYGFWGEWHNYPHTAWDISQANKDRILTAYKNAFTKTHVQLRDPLATTNAVLKNYFGYHDDAFLYETLGPDSWHFWIKMGSAGLTNNWQNHPMGGEIYPSIQNSGLWDNWPNTIGQDYQTSVTTTHATWLMNHTLFEDLSLSATQYNNALKGTKMLGYEFYVSEVNLSDITASSPLNVDIKIQNRGVAPVYYNWEVEFGVVNTSNLSFTSLGKTDWNINGIQPGGIDYLKSSSISNSLGSGNYKLLMRFVNPLEALYSNSKSLRFANQYQDADRDGWLTLGSFNVSTSLPLQLLSFSANAIENEIELMWSTIDETDFIKFELERRYEGVDTFEYIGSITGKGNLQEVNNYYFKDNEFNERIIYYRLKLIGGDGKIEYSNLIPCVIDGINYKIYPNPVVNGLNEFIIKSPSSVDAEITCIDHMGKILFNYAYELKIGENCFSIPYSKISKGYYFLKIIDDKGEQLWMEKVSFE